MSDDGGVIAECLGRIRLTETLLPQGKLLQLAKPIPLGGAVNDGVFQDVTVNPVVVYRALDFPVARVADGLDLVRVALLAMDETGEVVSLVQELEDGAENLGLLIGEGDLPGGGVHITIAQRRSEEGRRREDVLVSGEEALLGADDESDDGRSRVASQQTG